MDLPPPERVGGLFDPIKPVRGHSFNMLLIYRGEIAAVNGLVYGFASGQELAISKLEPWNRLTKEDIASTVTVTVTVTILWLKRRGNPI